MRTCVTSLVNLVTFVLYQRYVTVQFIKPDTFLFSF